MSLKRTLGIAAFLLGSAMGGCGGSIDSHSEDGSVDVQSVVDATPPDATKVCSWVQADGGLVNCSVTGKYDCPKDCNLCRCLDPAINFYTCSLKPCN
jgi:hypothetical protein